MHCSGYVSRIENIFQYSEYNPIAHLQYLESHFTRAKSPFDNLHYFEGKFETLSIDCNQVLKFSILCLGLSALAVTSSSGSSPEQLATLAEEAKNLSASEIAQRAIAQGATPAQIAQLAKAAGIPPGELAQIQEQVSNAAGKFFLLS